MTSARLRIGVRAGALSSALIVLGAVPAGAATQAPALSPGCDEAADGRVTCTFTAPTTGDANVVEVPANVTSAQMTLRGGAGGAGVFQFLLGPTPDASPGGAGGTAVATVEVAPGSDLEVRVGGAGQDGVDGGAGGAGGGGAGSVFGIPQVALGVGGGGGGGSEVRVGGTNPASDNPLVAAGGGGGGGSGFPLSLIPGPGPGGAGGGEAGASAPGIDLGLGSIAGGGAGGTQTTGGAGGTLLPALPVIEGEAGARGVGGDAPTAVVPGIIDGTGAGGGGGGLFGGGAGSLFSGGGGGSGFGPAGTTFGTGPDPAAAFSAAALPDGEVLIEFAAPEDEDGEGGGSGGGDDGGEAGGGGLDPCSDVTRLTVSDRAPLVPLSC